MPHYYATSDYYRLNLHKTNKADWPRGIEVDENFNVKYWMCADGNAAYLRLEHPTEETVGRIGDFFYACNVELACDFAMQCLKVGKIATCDFSKIPFHFEKWYNEDLTDEQAKKYVLLVWRLFRDVPIDSFCVHMRPFIISIRLLVRVYMEHCTIDDALFGHK